MTHSELIALGLLRIAEAEPFKLRPVRVLTRKRSMTQPRAIVDIMKDEGGRFDNIPCRTDDLEKDMRAVEKSRERRNKAETLLCGGRGRGKSVIDKAVRVSEAALKAARMIQGKPPYNTWTNYCYGDGYFARSCIDKFGEKMWEAANELVRGE
ncbi:hypothetical protein QJS83_14870 [Bdellovibrio sp. 22V]|uniref:hypothetical protein n=1 Tax=Bdellovibrio sp. 22V TaxID=3044166 RepID=UPI0025436495|nr:hypothetical protein [Bdellovibrio sp. 22V]WII71745.1 hypothetical protein QJS83_14870 [Bdellovibrio sp. 22V]